MTSLSICFPDERWKKKGAVLRPVIRRAVTAVLKSEKPNGKHSLSVRCVSEDEIRALNHDYRGKNKPTNVLSFTNGEADENGVLYLGDIVISLDTVVFEAKDQGKRFNDHLAHLCVHGVMHLLGYDHKEELAAEDMEAREIAILHALKIANPYR